MKNVALTWITGQYVADDDLTVLLHARDLMEGKDVATAYLHVCFSPDQTQAGYFLMARTNRLEPSELGCLRLTPRPSPPPSPSPSPSPPEPLT